MKKMTLATVVALLVGVAQADLTDWLTQAQATTGNVVADNAGYTFDGSAGIAYDYGNLGDNEVGSIEFIFNLTDSGTSIALGQISGWGSEKNTFKLEQWSDQGIYGVGVDGYFDHTFPGAPSNFDADTHLVFVSMPGGYELFVNGVSMGLDTRGAAYWTAGGVGMLGANSNGTDVPVGTIYGVGTYAAQLTPTEVMDLYTATGIPEPATLGMVAAFGGTILFIRRKLVI